LPSKHFERELVRGFLHEPASPTADALAITHGAGSNCEAPLLRALAEEFCAAGFLVLRYDLPYRQDRPKGPPFPAQAARDREGIRAAAAALRELGAGRIFLGGSSYGGRQTTMAAAEDPHLADALLLLSYPLHPPGRPEKPRTDHLGQLRTPAIFFHGTRDTFGTIEELRAAIALIPARHELIEIPGAPHGLPPSAAKLIASGFQTSIMRVE
jgi:predicted alpha/beta-hydrolase family hydrolase